MMKDELFSTYEKLRKEKMRESNLADLAKYLNSHNLVDILSKIGALSLMPENGSHLIRLEALAAATITNIYDPNKPIITKQQLQWMLNRYLGARGPIAQLEDPCENFFTESITFFDGSYIIFPGLLTSASFILRNICRGLFLLGQSNKNQEFKSSVYWEIMALLVISNEIAKKAELKRGLFPSTRTLDENVRIPKRKLFKVLQESVVFSEDEIRHIFMSRNIPIEYIEFYSCTPGEEKLLNNDLDSSVIYTKPIVIIENKYIVFIPELLISAAIHRVIRLAVEHGAQSELIDNFRAATWDNIQLSLKLLDARPISHPILIENKQNNQWLECCYQIDTDKIINIQYFSDDLKNYDTDKVFSEWVDDEIPKLIISRQEQFSKQVHKDLPEIEDVSWLILTQSFGRPFQFQLQTSELKCMTLALTAAELEVLGFSEHGDSLAIWKYLKRKIQVREKRPVISTSEIDEFEFYRSFKHSYPIPDDIDGMIAIKPGTGGDLTRKIYSNLDLHGVVGDQPHTFVEVISSIDRYFPFSTVSTLSHTIDRAAIVIEQFSIPVWIAGQKYTDPLTYPILHPIYLMLVDSIGYWLWQSKNFVESMINSLANEKGRLLIEMSLQTSSTWQQLPIDFSRPDPNESIKDHVSVTTYRDEVKIKFDIKESVKTWLVTPDNRVERELTRLVFQSLRDLNQELISDMTLPTEEDISKAIDTFIPLGIRKTIVMLPTQDPRFDDKFLPGLRLLQEADEVDVSKGIRQYLISKLFPNGILKSTQSKTKLLNNIVDYLYDELVITISQLKDDNLLEFLLAHYEAIVHKYQADRLKIPVELGSFYNSQELINELEEETPKVTQTSMALRFLIEYISACPPQGLRPISYEVYDRLIAIAVEIILLGTISDRIYYEIDDTSIEVKSGLLSIEQDSYYAAFRSFIPNYFGEVIGRSVRNFGESWRIPQNFDSQDTQNDLAVQFNKAFAEEFGLTFSNYQMICGKIMALGYEQDDPAKYVPKDKLVVEVSKETGITYDTVLHTIDSITLKERNEYLKPPSGYKDWEVFPWKFNRSLSFLRKPLIAVKRGEEEGIMWGNRHLFHSVEFLYYHCQSGKLMVKTQTMKEFVSKVRNEEGTAFNDEVYDAFKKYSNLKVRKRIESFSGIEMYDKKGRLGDIDVLVVNSSNREILTIECKNLNAAMSPYEYNNELKNLFIDEGEEDGEATKLIRRTKWVENNIELVLREMNVPQGNDWKYQPIIVTSEELFTPYLQKTSVTSMSIRRLLEDFIPNWIK